MPVLKGQVTLEFGNAVSDTVEGGTGVSAAISNDAHPYPDVYPLEDRRPATA